MLKRYLKKLGNSIDLENRKVIFKFLEPDKSAKLLDMGCGDGTFTLELGNHIGTKELYGIEIANEFMGQVDKKGIKVYVADLNEPLPIDDGVFDVIHSNQVIEHVNDDKEFLKEV